MAILTVEMEPGILDDITCTLINGSQGGLSQLIVCQSLPSSVTPQTCSSSVESHKPVQSTLTKEPGKLANSGRVASSKLLHLPLVSRTVCKMCRCPCAVRTMAQTCNLPCN